MVEGADEIGAVDIVANLFLLVAEDGVWSFGDGALHEVGEKAVELRARVIRAGEAAAAKAGGFHAEVAAVFLDKKIGGKFRNTEETVHGVVDGHGFRNAAEAVSVRRRNFPTGFEFDEREAVGRVAVDFVGRHIDKDRVGSKVARGFEQDGRAVGVDREVDGRIGGGPVVRRLSGSVNDKRNVVAVAREDFGDNAVIANVDVVMDVAGDLAAQTIADPVGGSFGTEKIGAHAIIYADDVEAESGEIEDGFGTDESGGTGDDGDAHAWTSLTGCLVETGEVARLVQAALTER